MKKQQTVDIRFTEFKSAKEKTEEYLTRLTAISDDALNAHSGSLKGIWESEEASEFYGKEVRVHGIFEDALASMREVIEGIDDEATLLYQIECFNRNIGLFRSY